MMRRRIGNRHRGAAGVRAAAAVLAMAAGGMTVPWSAADARAAAIDADAIDVRSSRHDGTDDLLTAGLGLDGLRSPTPPSLADPAAPRPDELRRRAIWSNWRGIADVAAGGGLGDVYGRFEPVPGREMHALLRLPGAQQPHHVMLQLPDAFATASTPCLVVSASSGSRGIYGAIALAGGWALPRGCAVAYTDKGAGTAWFDTASGQGTRSDGSVGRDRLAFAPPTVAGDGSPRVLFKHAHSGDRPEADWGRHVQQAAEFALAQINALRVPEAALGWTDITVIATGVSNGGAAVLRAAEHGAGWLDAVVAVAPNIVAADAPRPLYDAATEAALLMPCALAMPAFDDVPFARDNNAVPAAATSRCAVLAANGLIEGEDAAAQAADALRRLHASGWTDRAIAAGALSVRFDLWRSVAAAYAAAYVGSAGAAMPCGYDYAATAADGSRRAPTTAEIALWWSDSSGIPPGNGVALIDGRAAGDDPAWPGLRCLRDLWTGDDPAARTLQAAIAETRAAAPADGVPVLVMHGTDDGLVPPAFTSNPYVDAVRRSGRPLAYWTIAHAQHFDAFLGVPALAARYLPLLPYAWHGLDRAWAHLADDAPWPDDATIRGTPRGSAALNREALALP